MNVNCASNPNFKKLTNNQAAAFAIQLAKEKAHLCESKNTKQLKANSSNSRPTTSQTKINNETHQFDADHEMDNDYESDISDDDTDIVILRSNKSSAKDHQVGSLAISSTSDFKNLNDALKDAVKYVTRISESGVDQNKKNSVYLSENKILKTIKKCKEIVRSNQMEVDFASISPNYTPLISLVQRVFQSYKCLHLSFNFSKTDPQISHTMPCIQPFNIDFNSIRRSYSLLFGISNESVVEELEEAIDHAVYALCISIRMIIKKNEINELEMNQILHSLLVVNELPILEDPKYMDRSAKLFYATMSELSNESSVKIVRMWSLWQTDELKIYLNRLQQYITVCAISKNLDEESNNQNDDDDDETNENEQYCLHKSEGISGAVGILRFIYYASMLGGRLDDKEQIKRERDIEENEIKYLQTAFSLEENNLSNDTLNSVHNRIDQMEKLLDIRPIDCREPKIPNDLFINEVVNKFIDIQHDYVEYIQQMQNLENYQHHFSSTNKKKTFSFLSNPFFLILAKKNLGLYYDNKIKMMRERRHNIVMSIIEGSMPMPYFKIRLNRSNLLVDALSLIELQDQENSAILRKQLFVEFENEQGIDQGGVSKEFFQLAIDELLNKGYSKLSLIY